MSRAIPRYAELDQHMNLANTKRILEALLTTDKNNQIRLRIEKWFKTLQVVPIVEFKEGCARFTKSVLAMNGDAFLEGILTGIAIASLSADTEMVEVIEQSAAKTRKELGR